MTSTCETVAATNGQPIGWIVSSKTMSQTGPYCLIFSRYVSVAFIAFLFINLLVACTELCHHCFLLHLQAADFLGAELVQEVLAAKIASPFRIWTDEQQEAIFSPSLYLEASSNSKKSSSDASSDEETEPDADRAPFGGASTTPGSASSALSGPRSRALSRLGGGFGGGASDREQLQRLAAEAEKRLVAGNVLLQGDERAEALVREKYPWTMREPHVEAVLDAGVARRERQWGAGILSPARVALEARERGEKMRRRSLARSLLAAGSGVDETQAATDDGALEGEKVPPEARAVRRIGERDVAEGTGIGRSSLEETTEEVHPPEQREEMALGSQAAATLVEEGSMVGPVTSEESEGIAEVQETDAIPQSNNNVSQNDEEVSSTLEKEVENSNNSSVNSVEVPHSKESAQEAPSIVETQDKTPTEQGDSAAPSEDVSPPSVANASGNGPSSRKMLSGFRLKARQKKPAVVAETGDSA